MGCKKKKKILLVYPKIPTTYWSYKHILKFIGKKAAYPPLGLLTVAGLIPETYDVSLADLNTAPLAGGQILAADLVFFSAMIVQKDSMLETMSRVKKMGKIIVAGGPYPTTSHGEIPDADAFILGEAEEVMGDFFRDYEN